MNRAGFKFLQGRGMDNSGRVLVPALGGMVSEELVTAVPSRVN